MISKTLRPPSQIRRAVLKTAAILAAAGGCAAVAYAASNRVSVSRNGDTVVIRSNGIPDHATGTFPNRHNPNAISEQDHTFVIDATPTKTGRITEMTRSMFGVALNGVPLDPGAAEWYQRDRSSGWSYDPFKISGQLGLDRNNAHVQPNGTYHYHGLPTGLMGRAGQHSPLIGFAADGFPIYAQYGFTDGTVQEQTSSFRLKGGTRSSGPGGRHDGTFVEDWTYVAGAGSLDACNGKDTVTPEYPDGTYAYFITDTFPYISRCWVGTPSTKGFAKTRPSGGASGRREGSGDRQRGTGQGAPLHQPPGRDGVHRPSPSRR